MSTLNHIPVAGPWITKKEIDYVTDAVTNGWYNGANHYINEFEKSFAAYLGRKYAFSLPSCTSAIHLSLLALGIGPGDEVIVPDVTWIASAAPISYVGATPVFADIDPTTWCLSADTIKACLSEKTKAILVVNLYGHLPNWNEIIELSQTHHIPIIEDAAESMGSKYKNILSGCFGITSCFSFHGSKTLSTGEGGMLVTDNEDIYNQCAILRDHGRLPGDTLFRNIQVGYKYKMSNVQAALGLAQLERIEELVNKKRQIFSWYQEAFKEVEGITLNPDDVDVYNSYWMSTLLFDKAFPLHKHDVIRTLKDQGIHTRPFFDPLSSLTAYEKMPIALFSKKRNNQSYDIARRGINLPSALMLEKEHIMQVKAAIETIFSSCSGKPTVTNKKTKFHSDDDLWEQL